MGSVEEKNKPGSLVSGAHTLLEEMKLLKGMQDHTGQLPCEFLFFFLVYCINMKALVFGVVYELSSDQAKYKKMNLEIDYLVLIVVKIESLRGFC